MQPRNDVEDSSKNEYDSSDGLNSDDGETNDHEDVDDAHFGHHPMHTSNQDDREAHDDPDHDAYWAENDVEDPGRPTNTPDNPPRSIGIPAALPSLAAGNPKAKPTIPRQFPAPEKRLTPRKDFSSVYMDAQSQVRQLEREKFEYMKESDKAARAAAAVVDMRQAKSSLIEKLVASGVVDTKQIRDLVSIAFDEE
ncbi:hypothetical protein DYB26_014297 [Aphanomyces astaci]|uniref:Uncharacterized protein n=1 Tax=Aphanomyces astaci TaxID=112090 RepID=A0A418E255_APHAT|nr:hypothetical protein DYB26_014297 [Aphanomyces astaci]